jgi:hypothetical protein
MCHVSFFVDRDEMWNNRIKILMKTVSVSHNYSYGLFRLLNLKHLKHLIGKYAGKTSINQSIIYWFEFSNSVISKVWCVHPTGCVWCSMELKLKAVPPHAMKALGGRGDRAPTHSWPRHYMGWVVSVTPWPRFSPGEGTPRYQLYRRLGGPQSRSGHRGWRKILSPLPGIEHRSPGRPARSQTLYWLSYPAHHT